MQPVQRVCRYQLLLQEILKYTPADSTDHSELIKALDVMKRTVAEIDSRRNKRDISERTARFIQRFDGDWRINKHHVANLGNLLCSGAIEVTYTMLGQSVAKPRYLGCFVFPTYMILVRPKKVTSYEPKHWFPLKHAEFEDLLDIEGKVCISATRELHILNQLLGQREHSFIVRCKKHVFAFSASSHQEKEVWVKNIKEAINESKKQSSQPQLAEDMIVPSLSGVATKAQQPPNVRLSRSLTNILDRKISGHSNPSQPASSALKRSISTLVQLQSETAPKDIPSPPPPAPLKKRYSADYPATAKKKEALKSRNHSEVYVKPRPAAEGFGRRRPSSLDLLSSANSPANVIGRVSLQIRSNHQNALRMAVDHKLHDACTLDYLASRTWYLGDIRKRKSAPFVRSSASSFSIMSPRRASEVSRQASSSHNNDFDLQSNLSSTSSAEESNFLQGGRPRRQSQQRRASDLHHPLPPQDEACPASASRTSYSPGSDSGRTITPMSIFSGMNRTFSTYSMKPLKNGVRSVFMDKMLHKITHLSKRSQRRFQPPSNRVQHDNEDDNTTEVKEKKRNKLQHQHAHTKIRRSI